MGGPLYRNPRSGTTRWTSFENPAGARGAGGKANRGAKGHWTEPLSPGECKVLCNVEGCGLINRIWLTVIDRSPLMLRSLRIDMYRDGAAEPAVSAPLGANFGVMPDPAYGCWWGEGEVKVYLDGDRDLPTLVGTGTEDYIGSAWGQGLFCQRFVGCTVCGGEPEQYCFHRYHVPDPVFFQEDCRVTIQQMGGALKTHVTELMERGLPVLPVATDGPEPEDAVNLLERPGPVDLTDPGLPGRYVNFYREDDWSAAACFSLDKSVNGLPEL